MEITEQKIQEIEDRIVEKVLLMIPEVIGNLITHHVSMNKINKEFYEKNPELRKHKEVVVKILENTEGKNPLLNHKELLNKALPKIKDQINIVKGMSMEDVDRPSLDYNGEF